MYYYFIQSVHLECGLIRGWSLARDPLYIVIRGRPLLRAIMYYYLILFYSISTSRVWPDKRVGLWRETPYTLL
jgi:hypothetical protein